MGIKNEEKITVWQFEDEDGYIHYLLPEGVVYRSSYNHYSNIKGTYFDTVTKHFAELEAKEKEKEKESEWIEFEADGCKYKTPNGQDFQFQDKKSMFWFHTDPYRKAVLKDYYESNKDAILEANKKPKKETPSTSTEQLLGVMLSLEKRIEDLEIRTDLIAQQGMDMYERLENAKLSI